MILQKVIELNHVGIPNLWKHSKDGFQGQVMRRIERKEVGDGKRYMVLK